MRLIDADKFEVFTYTKTEGRPNTFDDGVEFVLEKIDEAPTVTGERNVLITPCCIGDKLYSKGHGNRKTPREWEVQYIEYNGKNFFFHIVNYENGEFRQSLSILESEIDTTFFRNKEDVTCRK